MSRRPPDPAAPVDDDRTLYPEELSQAEPESGTPVDVPGPPEATSATDPLRSADPSIPPFGLPEADRYRHLGVRAVGGMGVIEDVLDQRLGRRVVRKVAHKGHPQLEQRLAREAWVIAQLDHPGIVQALDAGELAEGKGYYIMPLVEGRSLQACLDEAPEATDRRPLLRTVRDACEAVGYAHREGFVHRDLKPDNIMVGSFGDTRVMDWGLARPAPGAAGDRWRGHFPAEQEALTQTGAVLGTPSYMSPEQARGDIAHPTADVWSLGVILFEILTGRRLFVGDDARSVLTAVIRGASDPLNASRSSLPRPLHAIVARALADDPTDRFPNAKALADELTRWLEGRVVESHQYTAAERVGTFVSRWRVPVAAALATAVLGVLGMGAFAWNAQQESNAAREAQGEAEFERKVSDFERIKGERYLQDALIAQIRAAVRRNDRVTGEVLAAEALRIGVDPTAMGALLMWSGQPAPEGIYGASDPGLGGVQILSRDGSWLLTYQDESLHLWKTQPLERAWSRPFPNVITATVSESGSVMVRNPSETLRVDLDGATRRYSRGQTGGVAFDPYSGRVFEFHRELRELVVDEQGLRAESLLTACADHLAFTPSGWWTACEDALVRESNGRRTEHPFPSEVAGDAPSTLDASADAVVIGTVHSSVVRVDPRNGATKWVRDFNHSLVHKVRISSSTEHVVALFADGVVEILDLETGQTLLSLPPSLVGTLALGLSDDAVLTMTGVKGLQRYRLDAGLRARTWEVPSGVTGMEFSPGSGDLAIAAGTTLLQLDWPTGRETDRRRFANVIKAIDHTSDGQLVVGASLAEPDTGVAVYARSDAGEWRPYSNDPPNYVRRMAVLGDAVLVGGWGSSGPRYYPSMSDETRWVIADPKSDAYCMTSTPDASRAAWGGASGLWVMDAGSKAPRLLEALEAPRVVALSADGSLAVVELESETVLVALDSGDVRWRQPRVGPRATAAGIDPQTRFTATGRKDGSVLIRDISSGTLRARLDAHQQLIGGIAFSEDGTTLVTGGWDNEVRLWDLEPLTGSLQPQLDAIGARWSLDSSTVLRDLR